MSADKAAGDTVPAEAVETLFAELLAADWSPPYSASVRNYPGGRGLKDADQAADAANRGSLVRALAAAAPLIVADLCERDLQLFDDQAATIARLTAEVAAFTDAAGKVDAYVARLTAERDAALAEVSRLHEAIADGIDRSWRVGLDTPGGP